MIRSLVSVSLLGALLFTPALASADSKGQSGRIIEVQINTAGSDDHAQYRGEVTVRSGKKNTATETTYKWGGSVCPGKDLTEHQVELLVHALTDRGRVSIVPRYKNGQGGNKCLVAFSLASHKHAGTVGQEDPT